MQFFEVLQVIIAIIFIYLILSLLASELQEAIATFIEFRSRNLHKSIAILLDESDSQQGEEGEEGEEGKTLLTDLIYKTSTINSLNQYTNSNGLWKFTKFLNENKRFPLASKIKYSFGPSYLDKETFVEALLQALQTKLSDQNKLRSDMSIGTAADVAGADTILGKLNSIIPSNEADDLYKPIKRLIEIAESVKLKKSNATLEDFRTKLGELFEKAQERTAGVYKRNAKGVSFIIGLLLASGLNVDIFYMVNSLSKNPKLAANISGVASNVWESNKDAFDEYAKDCINTPNGQNSNEQCQEKLESFKNSLQSKIESELESQPLEVDNTTIDDLMFWQNKEKQNGFLRIFGILISAIAIAMGAPFWFDLLGKFINVRNAGKPIQPKVLPKEISFSNTIDN